MRRFNIFLFSKKKQNKKNFLIRHMMGKTMQENIHEFTVKICKLSFANDSQYKVCLCSTMLVYIYKPSNLYNFIALVYQVYELCKHYCSSITKYDSVYLIERIMNRDPILENQF